MANEIDYTQEDKARELSAADTARVFILSLGSEDASGVKLIGEKSDSSCENIKTDDSGALLVSHS